MSTSLKVSIVLLLILMTSWYSSTSAQETKVSFTLYDGYAIGGYVDEGGYINLTGPNINLTHNDSRFVLGMLPSLRFKEDTGTPKNAFITPNLGVGFTYSYKIYAVQIPFYYNAKTATEDGQWHIGFGIGLRLNELNE